MIEKAPLFGHGKFLLTNALKIHNGPFLPEDRCPRALVAG
jgi:hypothetical protein